MYFQIIYFNGVLLVFISFFIIHNYASPLGMVDDSTVISCTCSVMAEMFDDSPVHNFGEIFLDETINNNLFGKNSDSTIDIKPSNCHLARQQCKKACATRLDLHLHYERFTPLGLMLCKKLGIDTPQDGAEMIAISTLNTTICNHHRHNRESLRLRPSKGADRLCCGNTKIVDETGNEVTRFGWNPDCMAQVYYLV